MKFIVSRELPNTNVPIIWLKPDNWDDYSYKTSFLLHVISADKDIEKIGIIKIIRLEQEGSTSTLNKLKQDDMLEFSELPESYCSLADNVDFYKKLKKQIPEKQNEILKSLNDIFYDPLKAAKFENKDINYGFYVSLLRDSETAHLFKKAKKEQTIVKFNAVIKLEGADSPHELEIDFTPYKDLPNRISILIGENGVGKTQLLSRIAISISGFEEKDNEYFIQDQIEPKGLFSNVITLSFSAFDNFEIPNIDNAQRTSYQYCGLRGADNKIIDTGELLKRTIQTIVELDFEREIVFKSLVEKIFPTLSLYPLVPHQGYKPRHIEMSTNSLLKKTSAGQRITLAILSNLVNRLQENSLVIFDEPENHLHPALLTAIMSFIGGLLRKYDSYAIVSTHSPLILQQIPSRYIQIVKRVENTPIILKTPIETFGENLTEISQNIFDIHEYHQDYTNVFRVLLDKTNNDPDEVEKMFEKGLSISAKSFLYSLSKHYEAK